VPNSRTRVATQQVRVYYLGVGDEGGKPMRVAVMCGGWSLNILAELCVAQALSLCHLHHSIVQGKII
jgi:hypothetical protein